MIYGLNFNGTQIPEGVARKFRKLLNLDGRKADLQGVAQSPEERDVMLVTAQNGHRKLHVVQKATAAGVWYGIYVYRG
jgi:hypothetical protein